MASTVSAAPRRIIAVAVLRGRPIRLGRADDLAQGGLQRATKVGFPQQARLDALVTVTWKSGDGVMSTRVSGGVCMSREPSWESGAGYRNLGVLLVVLAFGVQVSLCVGEASFALIVCLIALILSTIGMSLIGWGARRNATALRQALLDISMEKERERNEYEECRDRQRRRVAIRKGEVKDDGLSDFGRELSTNRPLAARVREMEAASGIPFPQQHEDIFGLEERDRRVVAAWKRRESAQRAWDRLMNDGQSRGEI
jgi:hypothetical protein